MIVSLSAFYPSILFITFAKYITIAKWKLWLNETKKLLSK